MVDIAITRMSSKGQVIIPLEMRKDFEKGKKIIIIKTEKQIIMKKMGDVDKNFEEDIEFARKTEEAFKRYERGEFIEMSSEEFLKELERW